MSGAQINLRAHGSARTEVSVVISTIDTPAARSCVGSAHQRKPMGAPSLRYSAAKRIFLPRAVAKRFNGPWRSDDLFQEANVVEIRSAIIPVQNAAALTVALEELEVDVIDDDGLDIGGAF